MTNKRVTIGDIARELGVSTSTVSRAINGNGYVSSKVRQRVMQAAGDLGYVPDMNARNLRRGESRDIGLIVSSLDDPFYAGLATGFEAVARARGYHVVLVIDRADPEEEVSAVRSLIAMGVCGVAMTPVSAVAVNMLVKHRLAAIQIDRTVTRGVSSVAGDNAEGGRLATRYLLDQGHRRIAVMIDHDQWTTGQARLEGYRTAYRECGLDVPGELVVTLGHDREEIAVALDAFMSGPERRDITAIFAANSVVSELLYQYCLDHGIAIPGTLSLVNYDDLPWTSLVRPAVSVVSQHLDELGATAAQALIAQLDPDAAGKTPSSILLQPELIQRASVRPLQ